MIHQPTLHRAACGQSLLSPDHPRRSRTAGKNLETRPAPRDDVLEDTALDGAVDDLRERLRE
ncbi:hypothetical protein ACFWBC_36605 [Streptomyces sp. NPDC059985]|uniref:hypothetical protein n=1 Tax=Streptomyces sp. NPDC059985 TaxID=3347025 RepID=UPI0036D1D92A